MVRSQRVARMQKTPRFPMGTRISKYFPGYKDPFEGTVDDYSKFSGFYHISYDDGDSEEMTETDLEEYVLQLPTIYPSDSSSNANATQTKKLILNLNDNAPGGNHNGNNSGKNSPSGSVNGSSEYTGGYQSPKSAHSSPKAASPTTTRQEPDKSQDEITNLIGKRISKPSVDGNGKEYIVYGTVSTYFNATNSITYVIVSTSPDSAAKDEQLVILNDGALKILSVLPGVTTGAVSESGIGRKLNEIKKHGAMWGFHDSTTELAKWVINKLKQELNVATKKSKPAREQKESSKLSNGRKDSHDEKRAVKSQPKPQERNQPSNGPDSASSKRSNSANHLRDLMGSRNGKGKDVLGNALSSKRKLGPAYAHRARRSTVILDAVARRFTEQVENVAPEKATEEEDETERESRIRFGEPSVIEFELEVEVSKLRSWAPMGRKPLPAPPRPAPAKQPLKSILRMRLEPIEQVIPPEPDHITAPPTIQTVSMSAHVSRQLKESGPTLYDRSEAAHDADQERSPDNDIPEPPQAFFTRKEQTNRSPPPDFNDRPSIDGERDSMSSLPESDASEAVPVFEIEIEDANAVAALPSPMQQDNVQPVLITSE
uniref:PTM/DIR17-like Tudor domain-containing protein n=1 Tax=Globisporangium ultimum (strain ATCC 200006 / CBS 805.95 / DAOM BR144) TaxID=431595 RepID=K3WKV5_GLOUD